MSLLGLPNELLISVFQHLSLKERHRSLPLVSRRCWQLLCSPQLLHTVDASICVNNDEEAMSMLRSLARFVIQRGAGSVRRLQLQLGYCGAQDHTEAECLMLAACAAAACSGLQQLTVSCEPILTLSSWLLPLAGSLRSLSTGEFTSAIVAGSLDFLTALQDLELGECSDAVLIPQNAQLPTSLTRLALGNGSDIERMPPQIGLLPNLRHLRLRHPYDDASSYAALARLSLHTLQLVGCVRMVPSCLSALTSLQWLTVEGGNVEEEEDEAVSAGLAAALPHLTRLSRLDVALPSPELLASLTALHSLRWLCWWWQLADDAALPPGSWLGQLQTLAAPQSLVANSLPALAAAHKLQQLCVYPNHGSTDPQLCAIINWAARHPSLQQLLLGDGPLAGSIWGGIAAASRLRPSLSIVPSTISNPDFDY